MNALPFLLWALIGVVFFVSMIRQWWRGRS